MPAPFSSGIHANFIPNTVKAPDLVVPVSADFPKGKDSASSQLPFLCNVASHVVPDQMFPVIPIPGLLDSADSPPSQSTFIVFPPSINFTPTIPAGFTPRTLSTRRLLILIVFTKKTPDHEASFVQTWDDCGSLSSSRLTAFHLPLLDPSPVKLWPDDITTTTERGASQTHPPPGQSTHDSLRRFFTATFNASPLPWFVRPPALAHSHILPGLCDPCGRSLAGPPPPPPPPHPSLGLGGLSPPSDSSRPPRYFDYESDFLASVSSSLARRIDDDSPFKVFANRVFVCQAVTRVIESTRCPEDIPPDLIKTDPASQGAQRERH
ncbi:uncharacterized protein CLUP02_10925 [Colletotrichum lupini]|uniref:Uncharacterized protein n=1 Tax=Colletotrichum lupini TaxID=145971 RepID=A0A9Q8SY83_9PEZI|nr:uncharacterized protein CLUP02_10925 [Colletotrichum lupini]UQC85428.1 hypothetical protein CLUP02_10925 [Colletotrichum lupini]